MNRFRYRQMFFFLVVLVLPTVAIIILWSNNASQERENAAFRKENEDRKQADRQKRTVADIGQEFAARLADIKLQVIAHSPAGAIPEAAAYSDPAVAFIGKQEGERLVWLWGFARNSNPTVSEQSEFSQKMDEAEQAEYRASNYVQAADLYRQASRVASGETQRASAELGLANALTRSGAAAEATRVYLELLNRPSTLVDDQGVPFASYAAANLSESHPAEVLTRLERDLNSVVPLTPGQYYQMRSTLETLKNSPGAASMVEKLAARINDSEQALEIQEKFKELQVTADATWKLYAGNALWWIGKASTGPSSPPLILAVRVEEIRKRVEAARASSFQLVTNGGEPLSESLPGVGIVLGPDSADTVAVPSPQDLFGVTLVLIVMLTFVGAFFLWRDTRRESRMAELRSQFVSSVSHELKTPLTSIRMFAESMQMDEEAGSSDPNERMEYLDTIVCETERLTRLLNNVLDFSRIERGQKNYHLEPEELPRVVSDAVRTMRFPLAEEGFNLRVDLCDDLPRLKVDRDAIEQAILNLLSNAMKYSGKNRDIALRLSRRNGDAMIQVSDHGIGIPEEEQRRIFEKFYRVPSKENRAISGTGLGLSLVAHIAEAHGGGVEVQSRPGEGSTFSIRLPLNGVPA
jgi:signal transduction histidine kinase/tetratricopeptide (TPR) repeat protein